MRTEKSLKNIKKIHIIFSYKKFKNTMYQPVY